MADRDLPPGATPPPTDEFAFGGVRGEIVREHRPPELEAAVRRLTDPAAAVETVHWGRNYLYRAPFETAAGTVEVVVKQFRNHGWKARLRRFLGRDKATLGFRMARAFEAAGIPTTPAVMRVEPEVPEAPSFFVSRHLEGTVEARYLFRAANRDRFAEELPHLDFEIFLTAVGRLLRRMHDRGFFHRDLSIGNVLFQPGDLPAAGSREELCRAYLDRLYVIDLNRARRVPRPSLRQRTRDLCRLPLFRRHHRRTFLRAYWGEGGVTALRAACFHLYHRGFHGKIAAKKRIRAVTRRFRDYFRPRRAHPHIPAAEAGATAREKIVWDPLSDQPHQHAGRLEKLAVRLADAPSHLRQSAVFLAATPRIWRRYRRLRAELYRRPVPWPGVGVCLRPHPDDPGELLAAVDELAPDHLLIRLHPWQAEHDREEELARELHRRGYPLAFSLPQNRELVHNPALWRRRIEELGDRFAPFGRHFQVGQAINRSKWGVWKVDEYLELASAAAEVLEHHPGVEILGPAVIDFELQATAGVLNLPGVGFRFDAVASLLYVDRRGAPENPQLGFDTVGKTLLLQAIADTARNSDPRSWITEVNWPLWEGPHSPAGRTVSVDEETQADYLARFYLLTLTTGAVERVYWWQLVARGYGLIAPDARSGPSRLRRRPSFRALATLARELRDARSLGPLPAPAGCHLFLFQRADGGETVAGWSASGPCRANLPRPAEAVVGRDGEAVPAPSGTVVELGSAVRYFRLQT